MLQCFVDTSRYLQLRFDKNDVDSSTVLARLFTEVPNAAVKGKFVNPLQESFTVTLPSVNEFHVFSETFTLRKQLTN